MNQKGSEGEMNKCPYCDGVLEYVEAEQKYFESVWICDQCETELMTCCVCNGTGDEDETDPQDVCPQCNGLGIEGID